MPTVQMDPDEVDAAAQGMQARARDLADAERLGSLDVPPAVAAALGALTSGEERLTGAAGLGLSEIA
ncbi:MAG: hypothetical protein IH965_13605, partial [Gemmatimonadetes bacterium]|nr:hypothetical protein [Gemmatimonadota bacterium]